MTSRILTYKERKAINLIHSYMVRKAYIYQRMLYWLDFANNSCYNKGNNKLCFLSYNFAENDYDNAGIFSDNVILGNMKHTKIYFFKDISDYVLFDKDFSADNKRAIIELNKFKLEQDFKEI